MTETTSKVNSYETRTAVVPVRFTSIERDTLRTAAKGLGLSLSEFIRTVACKRRLPPPSAPEINRRTYEELARLGNNLNQLARAVHTRVETCVDIDLLRQIRDHVRLVALEVLGVGRT
jgi:hypothetical protein